MSFWGSVGNIVKAAGNKVVDTAKEAKEIQQNEMSSKGSEELMRIRNSSSIVRKLAASKELKDRGLL
ncbi:MAG TPA: hypothetical protein EYG80_02575 [Flavobacteriaceae bacterium]|nr:hypothetical protein [Flavobacteriaceae bacterium]